MATSMASEAVGDWKKESIRNVELQWLLKGLQPNYHTIADFKKINPNALKNLFKLFVLFLKDTGLKGIQGAVLPTPK